MLDHHHRKSAIFPLCWAVAVTVMGCHTEIAQHRSGQTSIKSIITTVKENASGSFFTQRDSVSQSRIAQVQIPQGALAVDQTVTVSASHHTDPGDLMAEFAMQPDNTVMETQVATVVSSNMDKNLEQPMTIALDLPGSGASLFGLTWQNRHFFVVYTVRDATLDIWKRGIMPDSALTVKDSRVMFQSQLLGRYELFESVQPIEVKAREQVVAKPDFDNPPIAITGVTPLIADFGETITLSGKYLTTGTRVFVGQKEIHDPMVNRQRKTISFALPKLSYGPAIIKVSYGQRDDSFRFVIHSKKPGVPPYADAERGDICKGVEFIGSNGQPKKGTLACVIPCTAGNQQGCRATADFPAVERNGIAAAQMRTTITIQGITGTAPLPPSHRACRNEADLGCRIEGGDMALRVGSLSAAILKAGVTPPRVFFGYGRTYGVFPNDLLFNFGGAYIGAALLNQASLAYTVTAPAGAMAQFWDVEGVAHALISDGKLNKNTIVPGANIYGVTGVGLGSRACSKSGDTDCSLTGNLVAAAKATLSPKNFKKGAVIGKITGDFPSATYPLSPGGSGWLRGDFNSAIRSGDEFSYFTSAGAKITAKGSPALKPESIKEGTALFGLTGKLKPFDRSVFTPANIRAGVKIHDVVGAIQANCRNMAKLSHSDRQTAPGKTGLDPFDTITDTIYPSENPWPAHPEFFCGDQVWQDVTSGGCKNFSPDCVFVNTHTKRLWAGYNPQKLRPLDQAKNYCAEGDWGSAEQRGSAKWRLPEADELLQASLYGLTYLSSKLGKDLGGHSNPYFLSTTAGKTSAQQVAVDIRTGRSTLNPATTSAPIICTLPLVP